MNRHDRQIGLAEVGAAGQARLARTTVDVGLDGVAADAAARYLAGAGVGGLRVRDAALAEAARAIEPAVRVAVDRTLPADTEASAFDLRDPACRDLCRGAHAALRAIRAALQSG